MKRSASLIQLSREHHPALKLAKRAQRLAGGPAEAQAAFMTEAVQLFRREMEPHFVAEETDLLPRLEAGGFVSLVRRTEAEHAEIRRLIAHLADGDAASLKAFGDLLEAHVRFEERELFAAAELLFASEPSAAPTARPLQPTP